MRSIHTIAQAREGEEWGRGIPLTDIERACRHYGITPDQYLACPECYLLPERGAGLVRANPQITAAPRVLVAECDFGGHPMAILLASGSFNLDSSVLPAQVVSNKPANLRVVFDYLSGHFGENHTYYVWNFLYRKYEYAIGLDSIHLLASNNVSRGIIKDFGLAYPGTLIWESGDLTIEDLLGHTITKSGYYTITFALAFNWFINWDRYYFIPVFPGCCWIYDNSGSCRPISTDDCIIESLAYKVYVNVPAPPPPPPDFHFYLDLCNVDKSTVSPTEQFHVKLTIENSNTTPGPFYVGCFCRGAYQQLWQGTWSGGYSTKTLTVTANQLAQQQITRSDYYAFTFTVSNTPGNPPPDATINNPNGITGRWTPAAIYVNVPTPPPPGSANLSGKVTDKSTGAALANVSVSVGGYSTSTNSSGNYSLTGLTPGTYTVKFEKDGYNTVSQSKTLVAGDNILNVEMTEIGVQPLPSTTLIGGAAILAGIGIVLLSSKRERHGKR
jgi:hypothetical protein